jgi:hypothetical protein
LFSALLYCQLQSACSKQEKQFLPVFLIRKKAMGSFGNMLIK